MRIFKSIILASSVITCPIPDSIGQNIHSVTDSFQKAQVFDNHAAWITSLAIYQPHIGPTAVQYAAEFFDAEYNQTRNNEILRNRMLEKWRINAEEYKKKPTSGNIYFIDFEGSFGEYDQQRQAFPLSLFFNIHSPYGLPENASFKPLPRTPWNIAKINCSDYSKDISLKGLSLNAINAIDYKFLSKSLSEAESFLQKRSTKSPFGRGQSVNRAIYYRVYFTVSNTVFDHCNNRQRNNGVVNVFVHSVAIWADKKMENELVAYLPASSVPPQWCAEAHASISTWGEPKTSLQRFREYHPGSPYGPLTRIETFQDEVNRTTAFPFSVFFQLNNQDNNISLFSLIIHTPTRFKLGPGFVFTLITKDGTEIPLEAYHASNHSENTVNLLFRISDITRKKICESGLAKLRFIAAANDIRPTNIYNVLSGKQSGWVQTLNINPTFINQLCY